MPAGNTFGYDCVVPEKMSHFTHFTVFEKKIFFVNSEGSYLSFEISGWIYLFTLNKKYTLDGDFSWNTAGLINHSCNNNCDYEGKGLKIWVTAIKDIKKFSYLLNDASFKIHSIRLKKFIPLKRAISGTNDNFVIPGWVFISKR